MSVRLAVGTPERTESPIEVSPAPTSVAQIRGPDTPNGALTGFRLVERPTLSLVQPSDRVRAVLKRARGKLFVAGPSPDDIRQGEVGDCYFIAALAAVAAWRPDIIRDMVRKVNHNVYEVRFYDEATGRPVLQRVTRNILVDRRAGTPLYARSSTP
ncbi:MAG: hypothetical protein H7Z43_06965, partial [Clostridia bacterium]|nr:hypothetical protein [Deltaproteobacteria bacterium]